MSERGEVQDAIQLLRTWAHDHDEKWWHVVVLSACDVIEACLVSMDELPHECHRVAASSIASGGEGEPEGFGSWWIDWWEGHKPNLPFQDWDRASELRAVALAAARRLAGEREVIVEGVVDAEFCGVYQGEYDVDVKLSGKWSRLIGQHVSLVRRRT